MALSDIRISCGQSGRQVKLSDSPKNNQSSSQPPASDKPHRSSSQGASASAASREMSTDRRKSSGKSSDRERSGKERERGRDRESSSHRDRERDRDRGDYKEKERDHREYSKTRSSSHRDKDRDRREKSSRSSRSPKNGHRSRIDEDYDDPEPDTDCGGGQAPFSTFYKDRFGDHSPEDYQNLRLSHFDNQIPQEEVRDILMDEFERFGDLEVKVVRHPSEKTRLAYVNFAKRDCARSARYKCYERLCKLLGRKLKMDPAGVIRDQEGKFLSNTVKVSQCPLDQAEFMSGQTDTTGTKSSPMPVAAKLPPSRGGFSRNFDETGRPKDGQVARGRGIAIESSRGGGGGLAIGRNRFVPDDYGYPMERGGGGGYGPPMGPPPGMMGGGPRMGRGGPMMMGHPGGRGGGPPMPYGRPIERDLKLSSSVDKRICLKDYIEMESRDEQATRTLFVGNLPADVKEIELRAVFERYTTILTVEIKQPEAQPWCYAFVHFENLDEALEAKYHETGRDFGPGKLKIGFGKPRKNGTLWIGGLGPWTSVDALTREFDRYGMIEKIEYEDGAFQAYVTFASVDAAADACRAMRGFPLGGREHCIRVDYAPLPPEDIRDRDRQSDDEDSDEKEPKRKFRKRRLSAASSDSSGDGRKRTTAAFDPSKMVPLKMEEVSDGFGSGPSIAPPPEPPLCTLTAATIPELETVRSPIWTGALVLKKSAYAIRLYKLAGDDDLIDSKLRDPDNGESVKLHVTQRLPFTASNLADRFQSPQVRSTLAFMIAIANANVPAADLRLADSPSRPLKAFIHYLIDKGAAGVVGLSDNAVLYAFPHCELATSLLRSIAPSISVVQHNPDNTMLLILSRAPCPQS